MSLGNKVKSGLIQRKEKKNISLGSSVEEFKGNFIPSQLQEHSQIRIKSVKRDENQKGLNLGAYASLKIDQKKEQRKTKNPSYYDLAEIFAQQKNFAVMDKCLFYGFADKGYYKVVTEEDADTLIRQSVSPTYKHLINSNSIKEIIKWIKSFEYLHVDEEILKENQYLINFSNGILDVKSDYFFNHSLDFYFTNYIDAEYPDNFIAKGNEFERFIYQVTNGDKKLAKRIQEIFGIILSDIRDLKVIFYFIGKKDTGKSILLNLLEKIIGKDSCSHVSLSDFNKPVNVARLHKKKLNTCGETGELTLSRLDLIKAATGNDVITGEHKYQAPFEFTNRSAMLFAGNNLPNTRGIDSMNAFIDRLVIVPFDHPVPKEKQDINLLEKLIEEKSFIVKWAVEGLQRLIRNNYKFTSCEQVESHLNQYLKDEKSVELFIDECCVQGQNLKIYSQHLLDAYEDFCGEINILPVSDKVFHKTLQSLEGIRHARFRLNDENRKGYIGLDLRIDFPG